MGDARRTKGAEFAIATWAVFGVILILVDAIVRLTPRALEPLSSAHFDLRTGLAYLAAIALLGYCEGYRGFQRSFSPRVAARALQLGKARLGLALLAPLAAMGLLHATRRRLLASWGLVLMIFTFILLVRLLPQPWRGAVDAGVIVGLSWGAVATLACFARAVRGRAPGVELDFPE